MPSVFLAWLTECIMVLMVQLGSLGGEGSDMLGFEHAVFEALLTHLSVNAQ